MRGGSHYSILSVWNHKFYQFFKINFYRVFGIFERRNMKYYKQDIQSADYLYMVCREYPLLVISTESGIGKYHFSCIGYKHNEMLMEFDLIIDSDFIDSKVISEKIGSKYYLTVNQFLNAYKKYAVA